MRKMKPNMKIIGVFSIVNSSVHPTNPNIIAMPAAMVRSFFFEITQCSVQLIFWMFFLVNLTSTGGQMSAGGASPNTWA